jgi:hypothetical protein
VIRTLLVSCLVALGLCSGTAFSQTTNASLSGTVTDSSGAVIPNAAVAATDTVTGVITTATTNGDKADSCQNLLHRCRAFRRYRNLPLPHQSPSAHSQRRPWQ